MEVLNKIFSAPKEKHCFTFSKVFIPPPIVSGIKVFSDNLLTFLIKSELSFLLFLFSMTIVGVTASRKNEKTSQSYILANRSIGAIPISLSAVSTCHSGFMFIGMIGFTYKYGVSSIWMIVGWLFGDYIAWRFVYPKLRRLSEQKNSLTISDLLYPRACNKVETKIFFFLSILK